MNKPNWLYKPFNVDNLIEVQQQLANVVLHAIPDFHMAKANFIHVDSYTVEEISPLFADIIKSLNLYDKWKHCAIITTNNALDREIPIHIDHYDWKIRCYALNFPAINCDDSYTEWYDAEIDDTVLTTDSLNVTKTSRSIKKDSEPIMIGRHPVIQPYWMNISIPHRPVTLHDKPRAIVSARFRPEIHGYFD